MQHRWLIGEGSFRCVCLAVQIDVVHITHPVIHIRSVLFG